MEEIKIVPYPEEREIEVLKKVNAALERCVDRLEDALRWRKYPEEKPENDGSDYLVINYAGDIAILFYSTEHGLWCSANIMGVDGIIYWLPIPPLEEK
jgi:hypothetical protein